MLIFSGTLGSCFQCLWKRHWRIHKIHTNQDSNLLERILWYFDKKLTITRFMIKSWLLAKLVPVVCTSEILCVDTVFYCCVLVMSPRLSAGETECQLLSCKKKCFNLFRRLVQYELLRYHMSSETHGKFILLEEQQLKNTWLCGLILGKKKKKAYMLTYHL